METTVTKAGNDHHKARARELRRNGDPRRFPDILADLNQTTRPAPPHQPGKELVPLCGGLADPRDGGRCTRPAGHRLSSSTWSWCSPDPHLPVHILEGYEQAADEAYLAREAARRAALTAEERDVEDAQELDAAYWAESAYNDQEPYDSFYDKYADLTDALSDDTEAPDDISDQDHFLYDDDAYDSEDAYEVAF